MDPGGARRAADYAITVGRTEAAVGPSLDGKFENYTLKHRFLIVSTFVVLSIATLYLLTPRPDRANHVDNLIRILDATPETKSVNDRLTNSQDNAALELIQMGSIVIPRLLSAISTGSDTLQIHLIQAVVTEWDFSDVPKEHAQHLEQKLKKCLLERLNDDHILVRLEAGVALNSTDNRNQLTLASLLLYCQMHTNEGELGRDCADTLLGHNLCANEDISMHEKFGTDGPDNEYREEFPTPNNLIKWWQLVRNGYPKQLLPTGWSEADLDRY
ncbi:hypothetical protein JYT83_01215 [bacterium AH-315-F18]|nr:hypothetical protein [bacterium AH-315-F18]